MLISKSWAAKNKMGGGSSKAFLRGACLPPMRATAGRGLLSTPPPPLPPPRFASNIGGTCAFFSRRHCPRPPPSPLPTSLKLCGPPTGLTNPILPPGFHETLIYRAPSGSLETSSVIEVADWISRCEVPLPLVSPASSSPCAAALPTLPLLRRSSRLNPARVAGSAGVRPPRC